MLLSNFVGTVTTISPARASQQDDPTDPNVKADAVVLVNSESSSYSDFQHFIQPYLDNFGIPYTLLDIATTQFDSGIADYAVIIIGHRRLDIDGTKLNTNEESYITSAVSNGTGLVNFDNDLSANASTPRYEFVNSIFGFGYTTPLTLTGVTFPSPQTHYITERHSAGETIGTQNMVMAGITLPPGTNALANTGTQPFLVSTTYQQGHAVQWGSYDWMSNYNKGALFGLDDLVWRSIVWAARKPFVMQGMPPFVTMRMDDVSDPSWWVQAANDNGYIPWLGLFTDDITDTEAANISSLVNSGKATAGIHAFSTNNFFYYDHNNAMNFSDTTMAANYTAATQWFSNHNIPISKYVVPHYYEIGSNAFSGLLNWGVEYIGTLMDPGQPENTATWMMKGPYRLFEVGSASSVTNNPYYADFMDIPGHPELDGKFFNCISEIRDVTGYEWMGNNRTSVAQATQDGTEWLKRDLDSMAVATLFSHEYTFVNTISQADWRSILQGINQNIASYNPISVSLDYACQYARAIKTSNITTSQYNPLTGQITVTLGGKTDLETKFYLFTDVAGSIQQNLVNVPVFNGSTQVISTVAAPLDHIIVTPTSLNLVEAATQQFSAQGFDANNNLIPNLKFTWSVANGGGSIDANGLFTAGLTPGTYNNTIVASVGSVQGYASVTVIETTLDHFVLDPVSTPQHTGIAFPITIRARDTNGNLMVSYHGQATLSDTTGTVQPALTTNFVNGVWTGYITITQTANGVIITASDGIATGTSNPFDVVPLRQCPCSIWDNSVIPPNPNINEGRPIEVGVKFRSDINGYITGLRFYKGDLNTGIHTGHLWKTDGTLLATVIFNGETGSGWQQVILNGPVPITANTTYIASYFSPGGYHAESADYFSAATINPPLKALANDEDGPNGVYRYDTSELPNLAWVGHAPNYWVDVVFNTSVEPDTIPPTVISTSPQNGATGVNANTKVSAVFSESLDPTTVNTTTFELLDPSNALITASVTYREADWTALLAPSALLGYSTTYTARVKGGANGVKDLAGNPLAADISWSFTTSAPPAPPPDEGPGGPILIVSSASNPFSRYYAEILRAEGLNEFMAMDISKVTADTLNGYQVVILGEMPLTTAQVTMFTNWVTNGGNLIAMRPDAQLANLLGLSGPTGTRSNAYLLVDTSAGPGNGIVNQSMQFHGPADLYTLNGATSIATLYSDTSTPTSNPAVTIHNVGSNNGQAVAFTYDLARSIVYTRQGNPAWAGQERDGISPIRPDDLFYGNASFDPQPDWIDLNKVAIPQADEQQRLLANLINFINTDKMPLPRFWYLPRGEKAVVLMSGDDHGASGTEGRFEQYIADSPAGCSVDDWGCIRSSSYLYPNNTLTDTQAVAYNNLGFEVAMHLSTNCMDFTPASLADAFTTQISQWHTVYPSLPLPTTNRTHCIVWSDWDTEPMVELQNGIRLDLNYYYWPPAWIQDRPGFFTGSGMPMRFAGQDGSMIDVYQATTQMTDESGQSYPFNIDTLLSRALGPEGYYGVFTANMHTDLVSSSGSDAIINSAKARGVPVVSGKQMLKWLDGRNSSAFQNLAWNGNILNFSIAIGEGANGLQALIPTQSHVGTLTGITLNGSPVAYSSEAIKCVEYAAFLANVGTYQAIYAIDNTPPVITNVTAVTRDNGTATITWTTDEASSSRVDYGTDPGSLISNNTSASLVTSHSITINDLLINTTYYYRVSSTDGAGNSSTLPAVSDPPASFTEIDNTPPVITNVTAVTRDNGTATITWTTDEASDSRVDYGTDPGSLISNSSVASLVTSHSITINSLIINTTYYYRVTSKDGAGNSSTLPAVSDPPASFAMPSASFIDTTVADFSAGTLDANTYLAQMEDGELLLKPTIGEEFSGTSLPADWDSTPWTGGTSTVSGSSLVVDGARANTNDFYTPGRAIEFEATFGAAPFQHAGFGQTVGSTSKSWAMFSTWNTTGSLYARTDNNGTMTNTLIPGNWVGTPHRYRIEWNASSVVFYIDGNPVDTENVSITDNMRPVVSDYNYDGATLNVDWIRLTPYSAAGIFTSRVFDGGAALQWQSLAWTSDLPTGTGLTLSVRTGNTPTPDENWTAFAPVANSGDPITGTSRYIQYQAALSTSAPDYSPVVKNVDIYYSGTPGNQPPVITAQPSNQTVNAGQTATFSASATGSPAPTIQWQVNPGSGWTDIPGATAATLSFTAQAADNGKQYHAVFTNAAGSATTNAASLTVNVAPTVTTQPADQTVNAGQTATFSASATGSPAPTIQWQVNPGSGWSDIPGATAATLSFTTQAADNGKLYRAVFTNAAGSATTNAASLTVNVAPTVTTQPADQTVNAGQTATFSASASGNPVPTVQWQVNAGSGWTDIPGATAATLSFTAQAADNGKLYRAVFTNLAGSATTNPATLTVNQPPASFIDTTVADFSAGTLDANTYLAQMEDGELLLKPAIGEEFSGTSLPTGWYSTTWTGGTSTVLGGSLVVDGARANTDADYTPGRALEFAATFGAAPYQHVGFTQAPDFSGSWAMFSTNNTTGSLFARTNNNGAKIDTFIPGSWVGTPHRYRIEWNASSVVFYIDGSPVDTENVSITDNMRPVVSDYNYDGATLNIDWMRLTPYSASAIFTSRVFDGGAALQWQSLAWTSDLSTGTGLTLSVRTGDTPTPDDSWTAFTPVANSGDPITGSSRYIQYQAELSTSASEYSPVLKSVAIYYSVTPLNHPPVANAQTLTTTEDTPLVITLSASDVDGDPLSYNLVTPPAHGSLSGSAPNLNYSPDLHYFGPDSFTFKANDGSLDSNIATVSITVTHVNHPPVANAQTVTTTEDTPLPITLSASDVDGDPLSYSLVTPPVHGALSGSAPNLTYTPDLHYHGPDSFTFKANDGFVDSNVATVSITITHVNHPPVANAQTLTTTEDTPLVITLSASDVDGDPLSYNLVTPPAHGSLSGSAPNLNYSPDLHYFGPDSFTFKANDGSLDSNIATVSITVTHVNHPPVANAQTVTTTEDTPLPITLSASDVDGDPLSYSLVTPPVHGALSGSAPNLTYTPDLHYHGPDSFTFKANDGFVDSNVATVSITITHVNHPPVANAQTLTTTEDTPLVITLSASDVDGDPLSYSLVTPPAHGSLSGSAPNLNYSPDLHYFGPDSFTFKANDGTADSNVATVSITVTHVDHPPVANAQTVTTTEDTPLPITLSASDVDGDPLSYSLVTPPVHGALSGSAPNLTYTPDLHYHGPDSFTFKANDGFVDSNVATVSITVTHVNHPPVVTQPSNQTSAEGQTVSLPIAASDPDGDVLSYSATNLPAELSINPATGVIAGTLDYGAALSSPYLVTVTASDGSLQDSKTYSWTVSHTNRAPVAANDNYTTNENTLLSITAPGVLSNDTDVDGDALTAVLVAGPTHGTLTLNANGSFSYTPATNYNGSDSFTYNANDGSLDSNIATVSITVIPDLIFKDGFESGNLSAWSSSVGDPGDLVVTNTAALVGSQGLQVRIDDNTPTYLVDNTPNAEARYRARFYFDPNSITMANGDMHYIFTAFDNAGKDPFDLYFRSYNGEYQIRASLEDNSNLYYYTSWFTLTDSQHYLEIDWQAASAPGAYNGYLSLWIDGVLKYTRSAISNDTRRVERVFLGPWVGIDSGTRGTYYFDAFESHRQTYIGMAGVQADFSASPTSGSAPLNVAFTSLSVPVDKITSYLWDFGDGQTSTAANPLHTYTTSGDFTVSLTVTGDGDQKTATKTAYIHVSDLIFKDGFENGNLSAWSSSVGDPGDLVVTHTAALVGSQGLQVRIDDNTPTYLVDNTPNAEARYRARFYFDPNSITMANGDMHYIFTAFDNAGKDPFDLYFRSYNGEYQIRASLEDNSNLYYYTSWFTLTDSQHYLEIDWQAASAPGAYNGYLSLWIDGVLKQTRSAISNDTRRVDSVRLGPWVGIDSGTRGTYFIDAFESHRQNYIGMAGVQAGFSASPTSGSAPLSVAFTSLSVPVDKITSYLWDFGDGQTSTAANPLHTYTTSGDFTVSLTVTGDGDQKTATKTAYIHVSDLIFKDGFESGNLSAWSSSVGDPGDLVVTHTAALVGSQGLQVRIDDNTPTYLVDNTPNAEARYRARFYFDPNSITMANGDMHYIFTAFDNAGKDPFDLYFRSYNGEYQIRASLEDNSNLYYYTSWFTLTDTQHYLEIDWQAASAPGAYNGYLSLWIDGVLKYTRSAISNDTRRVESVRLGPWVGIDSGTRGSYYFDAFESHRQTYIGMAGVQADFSASPTSGSAPLNVALTSLSVPVDKITSYLWDFGDGQTSTAANPLHTYTTSGDFTVSLTVTGDGDQKTATKTAYIHVSDLIFKDGFESGNLSAWSSSVGDPGDLVVTHTAALVGSQGLQVRIDDNTPTYLVDNTPNAEARYRARFYFDPNSITMANGDMHYIFTAFDNAGKDPFDLYFRSYNGEYQIRASLEDNSNLYYYTSWFTLTDTQHYLEIDWQAASAPGAYDGYLSLWIDGVLKYTRSAISNDTRRVESVRLGPWVGIDSGTRGTYFIDAFESHRQAYIGP